MIDYIKSRLISQLNKGSWKLVLIFELQRGEILIDLLCVRVCMLLRALYCFNEWRGAANTSIFSINHSALSATHMPAQPHTHIQTHGYIQRHTRTHMHTHTHTHTHTRARGDR